MMGATARRRSWSGRLAVRCALAVGLLCGTASTPSVSQAAPPSEIAKAREQFQKAISLEAGGDWAGALALLREVSNVRMTPQVRYNIALCEEHLGQLVAALGDYELASADATEAKAQDVIQVVGPRLDSLRKRIPKLVVQRGNNAEVATVSIDGVEVGAATIGREMPVNPGAHVIEARSKGFLPFSTFIDLGEKDSKTIEIILDPAPVAAAPVVSSPTPVARAESAPPAGKRSLVPLVVGGIGVASLAASGLFYYLRAGTTSDLDAACGPRRDDCPADARSTYDKGRMYNTLTNLTLAVGAIGVTTGAVLYLTRGKPSNSTTPSRVGIAPTLGGASVVGTF